MSIEQVTGYPYTHWDCPHCGSDNQTECDAKGEILRCQDCDKEVEIT